MDDAWIDVARGSTGDSEGCMEGKHGLICDEGELEFAYRSG